MKQRARIGLVAALSLCSLASFTPAWSADPPPALLGKEKQKAPPPVQTKVVSCAKTITVQAVLSGSYLKASVDSTAVAVNQNDVVLTVYGSTAGAAFDVDCFYKSEHGDVPNIVYRIPCKRPKKGATSYEHSYWCIKN